MPLNFLLDENQRGLFWRAVQRHNRSGSDLLDVARVGDLDDLPLGASDAEILLWAEREGRILVTFDKATMATHLANHLQAGRHSPGIFMLRRASQSLLLWPIWLWLPRPARHGNGKTGSSLFLIRNC
ncbi:MAG TPA: DUF5615 family PIN-like protein [Gemmataceae bacterium]|jgi:hypothetical protein|nr:DUF5615 family PIN-like protein [Gemmataceae bacterium]